VIRDLIDRIKGDPENPHMAELLRTIEQNSEDPKFYAVPGTTHAFVGTGHNCEQCGWAEGDTHTQNNLIEPPKPTYEQVVTNATSTAPPLSRMKRRRAEQKAEVLETYINAVSRAYEAGHISMKEFQVLLENPDIGIKHMLKGY
jgi:hypothetical protein